MSGLNDFVAYHLDVIRQHVQECRRLGMSAADVEAFVRDVLDNDPIARSDGQYAPKPRTKFDDPDL